MTSIVFDFRDFPKQFVISPASDPAPAVAGCRDEIAAGWRVQAAPSVPLVPIEDGSGARIGLLIGWSIVDGRLLVHGEPLRLGAGATVEEGLLPDLAGRSLCLWRGREGVRLQGDAGGFLPVVWAAERGIAASTSVLIDLLAPCGVRQEVAAVFDFPKRRGFLPFELTHHRGVRRLLPGHRLDLDRMQPVRVWPPADLCAAPLAGETEAAALVAETADRVQRQVGAFFRGGAPAHLYLSGGHDSRMLLAAARPHAADLVCETLVNDAALDLHIAAKAARAAGARHLPVAVVPSSRAEVAAWLRRAGWSMYDPVSELAATAKANERAVPVMDGSSVEILRASNWSAEDLDAGRLTVETLLRRSRLPEAPVIREAAEAWLAGIPDCDATMALDIAKIELIHGCWAAPSVYGHDTGIPSISPFASQRNNAAALRLPKRWKFGEETYRLWMERLWPEGLGVPVNRAEGIDRLRFLRTEVKSRIPTWIKRAVKPYR